MIVILRHFSPALICGILLVSTSELLRSSDFFEPSSSLRATFNFNPDWKFLKQDAAGAEAANFDDSVWEAVSTPHTFNDVDTFDELITATGERSQYCGPVWYRKHFKLPEAHRGRKVFLEFEGMRQKADLNMLQVHNPVGYGFIAGDSDQQVRGFNGKVSPMLTVWRRLWCEFDSMGAATTTGPEMNFQEGTIVSVSGSTLNLNIHLIDEINRYEDGRIYIQGVGDFKVLTNTDFIGNDSVVVEGNPGNNAIGKTFWIYDDDYYTDMQGNAPRPMPYSLSGGDIIYRAFAHAFIEPIKVTDGQYIQTDVPFRRNLTLGISFHNFVITYKNIPSATDLWSVHLLAAWQPLPTGQDSDNDSAFSNPDTTSTLFGLAENASNIGAVYVETVRGHELPSQFRQFEYHTVIHEIGHQGGGHHDDQGLMKRGAPIWLKGIKNDAFTPITIKRFRENQNF